MSTARQRDFGSLEPHMSMSEICDRIQAERELIAADLRTHIDMRTRAGITAGNELLLWLADRIERGEYLPADTEQGGR